MKLTLTFDYDDKKKVGLLTGTYFDQIRNIFSVENDAAKFARHYGRFIAKRKYIITPTGRFEPCMFFEIRKYIKENNIDVKLHQTESFKREILPSYSTNEIAKLNLPLRDYQASVVSTCLKIGRGVTVLATAGGKTLTIAALVESIYKTDNTLKCLIVVPDLMLVNQTFSDFKQYGVNFTYSKWTGNNNLNMGTNVVIANTGIMQSSKTDVSWISHVDMLIVDEVHKLRKANKINKILNQVKTSHKFGFTGTMPENQEDQWNIVGKIGPILFEKNSYQLRSEKYIANAEALILKLKYKEPPRHLVRRATDPGERYRKESEFLRKNIFRNNTLSTLINNFTNNGLVLIDYIEHGLILEQHLKENCPDKQVYFMRGDVPVEERDDLKRLIEKRKDIICVAISKIFSTGISINNLHYIVFAGGGKAKIKILQSIGRGLRKHKDKEKMVLVDIADQLYYGIKHMNKRLDIYKDENLNYGIKTIEERT
jgi:superfamily II DNA or RNA helicase